MLGQMMDMPLLLSSQIEFAARFHGSVEVVTRTVEGPVHRSNYGEIAQRSKKLANALVRMGIKQGDRVATIAWNTNRHLELYFAVSGMGAVLHTINPRLPPDQLLYVVNHAEDAALFYDTTFAKLSELLASSDTPIRHHVALTDDDYEARLGDESEDFAWPQFDERTASSLCYTSGTTGDPKGVVYSHRSTVLHSYAATMADTLAVSATSVTLPVVPMFHVNAWGVPYAAAMVGSKLVFPGPRLDGPGLIEMIESERVTSLLGVPTVWMNLLGEAKKQGKRFDTVQTVTIGGSACPPSMIEAFERDHGARVIHAWGMTETSPVGTVNVLLPKHQDLPKEERRKIEVKQGRPVFGVDIRIVNDDGEVQPHDGETSGHLQVRGPWVASGYYKRDPGESHVDGWFFTGDIATIDADGYMHITDRSKDVIKSGGEWVSSIAVENAAMRHPAVKQAAVIGVRHEKWQERPLLIVVPNDGETVDPPALLEFLGEHLTKWWIPDAVELVDALPVGATGKVLKRKLREQFADYRLP